MRIFEQGVEVAERQRDVLQQALREAALIGDGAVLQRDSGACVHCEWSVPSVWFASRKSYVCTSCGEDLAGAAPTREQRRAGHPDHKLRAALVAMLDTKLL